MIKRKKSRLITNLGMQFYSMYFRMSDRYIPYRSYRPEQERQDIPCHYRKKTKCLIPGAECYREITVDLGGRVAEELIFDDITTGASQDIKQATALARAMVTKFGMSEDIGLINYANEDDGKYSSDAIFTYRGYGEDVASRSMPK